MKSTAASSPIHHDRYGVPGASPCIHQVETPKGTLWEFPPPVRQWGKFHLPVGGGGYFRLYPLWWTKRCLRQVNRAEARPFVLYVHPWEIDPEQPIVHGCFATVPFSASRQSAKNGILAWTTS